ncbi:MAG: AAA family ATPase [Deltaproteobacteria bacterium]|nr:AAA family ATPase [Deltaproteobacteria bacterium]
MSLVPLDPAGTVRLTFEKEQGRGGPDPELLILEAAATAHDLPKVAVHVARGLVKAGPTLGAEAQVDVALLALATLIDSRQGSTRTPLNPAHFARLYPSLPSGRITRALEWAQGPDTAGVIGINAPLCLEAGFLYLGRARRLEERAAQRLRARLGPLPAPAGVEGALAEIVAHPQHAGGRPLVLSSEQQQAIGATFGQGLSLITGGPGTGKTSVVLGLLRTLVRLGVAPNELAISAPTGKAAQRLTQALTRGLSTLTPPLSTADQALQALLPQPQTLHRLLGYSPSQRRFLRHPQNPLPERFVIVDESSMIGLELMEQLLSALAPGTRLILLGDAEQLPSVEAGAVFRDLVELGIGVTRLTESYRMRADDAEGQKVLQAAQAIQAGVGPELYEGRVVLRRTPKDLALSGVELLHGTDPRRTRDQFLELWLRQANLQTPRLEHLSRRPYLFRGGRFRPEDEDALTALLDHHQKQQILTITRGDNTPTGAGAINQGLHRRWLERMALSPGLRFAPGEPVIALSNDYQRGLYNGDLGVVVTVAVDREAAEPMAVFPVAGGFIPHALYALGDEVELAHALTVHKAQGSEYERIALFLPEQDLPLLTREILYTALTRAKKAATFVGDPDLLLLGASRVIRREVGLKERLR